MTPDVDNILKLIADATIKRIDPSKPTYLFHSAGKDSNTIALALAKAEYQDNVTLITHKSKGDADESEISKSIAEQLGFKHKILYEVDKLKEEHKESISNYFINAPFPCTDSVTLAYPLYVLQVPELIGANIIFGDGNDSHMISPPSKKEQFILPYSSWFSKMGFIRKLINSESKLNGLLRTPAEWFGTSGLSDKDCKDIFNNIVPTYAYWAEESKVRSNWDVFNFKSDIFSTRVITEKMIRKLHNFVDVNNSKIILPFMEERTANYFAKMPEEYLFDRNNLTNKRVLRDLLKDKIGLDSDKIGKMGWVYDKGSVVEENIKSFQKEIFSCTYWDQSGINKVIRRFERNITKGNSKSSISKSWIYRLYLISSWLNNCKYVE
jgi:asparagine synthase (glutamine-hydrolysing)